MKKVLKLNKTLIVLGIIIAISLISFFGLYSKTNGVWNNILQEYNQGMDFEGYRELRFSLDTSEEEKEVYVDDDGQVLGYVEDGTDTSAQDLSIDLVETEEGEEETVQEETTETEYKTETRTIKSNEDSAITIENFELTKEIIQKRLNSLNGIEYNIRLDNITGEIVLEVPNNEYVSTEEALVTSKGTFDIIDYQTGIVLLDNSDIKNVKALANSEDDGYQLYLQLTLNSSGKERLLDISRKYVETTDEDGETSIQYVSVRFEGQTLIATYFGEELSSGILTIPVGNSTQDQEEFLEIGEEANRIAYILNEKELPLKYSLTSDNYIKSEITEQVKFIAEIVFALVIVIVSAILIVKFKLNGLILSIVSVGYLAITLLLLRYASVCITLNSIYAIVACVLLNYVFIVQLLRRLNEVNLKLAYTQTLKNYYLLIIPVIVFAVVLTITASVVVNSIGMTLFWGVLTQILYNALVIFALKLV